MRLTKHVIRDGKRVGLHLDKDIQEQIKDIKTKMSNLGIEFQKNMNEDKTSLYFTAGKYMKIYLKNSSTCCTGSRLCITY